MGAILVETAKAVYELLTSMTIAGEVNIVRAHLPAADVSELQKTRITVAARGQAITPGSRRDDYYDVSIDVAVQKAVARNDVDQIDAILEIAQAVMDFLAHHNLGGSLAAKYIAMANDPAYSVEHLHELGVLTTVITATYRVARNANGD